jgi:hypothetical protein
VRRSAGPLAGVVAAGVLLMLSARFIQRSPFFGVELESAPDQPR